MKITTSFFNGASDDKCLEQTHSRIVVQKNENHRKWYVSHECLWILSIIMCLSLLFTKKYIQLPDTVQRIKYTGV